LQALVPRSAGDGEVHAALARTLARLGERAAAIAAYETACSRRRADTALRIELAQLQAEAGNLPFARSLLSDVLAHAPGDARARQLLATLSANTTA
jgi:Flp pilus assembly protein TadD